MFTGIIEEIGNIARIVSSADKKHLTINCKKVTADIKLGDSVACNGICLTVIRFDSSSITVEVMNETMQKSSASKWTIGSKLNLERALLLTNRLDGHIVQGHVDSTSFISNVKQVASTKYITIALPAEWKHLIVPQGSIAINGISLTVAKLSETDFQVALISFTEGHTTLTSAKVGEIVNLEFDIIGKYLYRFSTKPNITKEWLSGKGF